MLPANKHGFKQLVNGLTLLVKGGGSPEDIVRACLTRWVRHVAPGIKTEISIGQKYADNASVLAFSDWLLQSDFLVASFWLSSAYASLLDSDYRKSKAMFFTPPYLSRRMLGNAGAVLLKGRIVDPSCGGAAFLAPAAQGISEMLEASGKSSAEIVRHIEDNLYGVDSDRFLCEMSKTFISVVLARHIQASGLNPKFKVVFDDGLTSLEEELGSFDLVLSNPPYRKITRDEIGPLKGRYGSIMEGQPNLYTLFIKRSIELLRPDGMAVLLTPMSFLSGQSFARLRRFMVSCGHISELDMIHEKIGVFLDAQQDSVITSWVKTVDDRLPTEIYLLDTDNGEKWVGRVTLQESTAAWAIPRNLDDAEIVPLLSGNIRTLATYGYRPKTGAIVPHRDKRRRYVSRNKTMRAGKLVPLIWPHDIAYGKALDISRSAAHRERFIDVGDASSPAIVTRPAIVMQRVTSSNQSHRLICAMVPDSLYGEFGGVAAENHVCFIVKESINDTGVDPDLLCRVLSTDILDRIFRCISGATNVSAFELNRLPLPDMQLVVYALNHGLDIETATRVGFGLEEFSNQRRCAAS